VLDSIWSTLSWFKFSNSSTIVNFYL
jgi:hypothetical protein